MPIQKYLLEIKWRFFYCILTFLMCFLVLILFIDTFFLIEVKPLINLGHKNFLATHVTDFFFAALSVSLFFSQLFTFPVIAYHVYHFLIPSFYTSQLLFLKYYIICSLLSYSISFLLIYNTVAPEALSFLIQWGSLTTSDLLNLELDVRIKEYLNWINRSYNTTNLILQTFLNLVLYLSFSLKTRTSFSYLKLYKKHLTFFILCSFYAILPPDLTLQFIFSVVLFLLTELFFYITCFRLKQLTFPGSSIG